MYDAIVPGTFDPVTNGHIEIIERAARMFGSVFVAVADNLEKTPWFSTGERLEMLRQACGELPNVAVGAFNGLLVNYAAGLGVRAIVRGLRAVSDFEYELQMAHANRRLCPTVETVFVMTTTEYSFLSSSIVKQISRLGGSVEGLVPDIVREKLLEKAAIE